MTVKELIEVLSKFDDNANVYAEAYFTLFENELSLIEQKSDIYKDAYGNIIIEVGKS